MVPGLVNTDAIALHKHHIDLIKFTSRDDHAFQIVVDQINVMVRNATLKIKSNWDYDLNSE